jgi:hypothetical protein
MGQWKDVEEMRQSQPYLEKLKKKNHQNINKDRK